MNNNVEKDFEGYEPTSTEVSEELSKLSDKVLLMTIIEQIDNIFENKISNETDILNIFDERYDAIKLLYNDNDSILECCNAIKYDIYLKIATKIIDKFKINTDLLNYASDNSSDFYDMVREMYHFFILKYKENLKLYFKKLYLSDKTDFSTSATKTDKEDFKYKQIKKVIPDNPSRCFLIYNLENILREEVEKEIDPLDIIEEIVSFDEYEITNIFIKNLILNNKYDTYVDRDFKEAFFGYLENEDNLYDLSIYLTNELMQEFTK